MFIPSLPPQETILRATIIYLSVFVIFRIFGRREWTRYSAFNVAVLFLVGVSLRTTLVSDDSSLTTGILSFGTIMFVDWCLSLTAFKNERLSKIVNGEELPLIKKGRVDSKVLKKIRLSKSELIEQLRLHGVTRVEDVMDARMERNGQISVLTEAESSLVNPQSLR